MKKPKISPKKVMMAMMARKAAAVPPSGGPDAMGAPRGMPPMDGMKKGGSAKTNASKSAPAAKDMGAMGMKKGGASKKMSSGGKAGCYARGGGIETKGKTKGKFV